MQKAKKKPLGLHHAELQVLAASMLGNLGGTGATGACENDLGKLRSRDAWGSFKAGEAEPLSESEATKPGKQGRGLLQWAAGLNQAWQLLGTPPKCSHSFRPVFLPRHPKSGAFERMQNGDVRNQSD